MKVMFKIETGGGVQKAFSRNKIQPVLAFLVFLLVKQLRIRIKSTERKIYFTVIVYVPQYRTIRTLFFE